MSTVRFRTLLLASALAVGSATAVSAQGATDGEARALFDAGTMAYDAGRYEDALARFQEAYRLSGRPSLLWNVALAADRARRDELALETYRRFLAETPENVSTDLRARASARIAVLEREVEAARAAAGLADEAERERQRAEAAERERAAAEAEARAAAEEAARAEAEAERSAADAAAARREAEEARSETSVTRKWWFWTIVGVGVAGAVTVPILVTRDEPTTRFPSTDHGQIIFTLSGRF